jgi:molecular chaperone GrpE
MEEKDIANPETAGTPETETPVMDNNTADETPKIQELQQQLDEARNKYLYLFSDFDNYRRNAARERMDLIQTAGRDVLTALLPVLDDFDRAEKNDALTEGTRLIHQKLVSTLQTKGLKVLEINVGDDFNADFQEAVAEIPAASEAQKGKIIDILEQGYQLGERIIRFAKVVVGR